MVATLINFHLLIIHEIPAYCIMLLYIGTKQDVDKCQLAVECVMSV